MYIQTLPESLRYLLAAGQQEKALNVLKAIASSNRTRLPQGTFQQSALVTFLDFLHDVCMNSFEIAEIAAHINLVAAH
jgi:hypothetical protein